MALERQGTGRGERESGQKVVFKEKMSAEECVKEITPERQGVAGRGEIEAC